MVELMIVDASWHRNGVGGMGFYAVLFDDPDNGRMVASLFDAPGYCAVYKVDLLAEGDVVFGRNSWRGDSFEARLRPALKKWVAQHDSGRLGPFSAPVFGEARAPRTVSSISSENGSVERK